jgi:pimeloyl-ACP methyl ester carboxylesterase
MAEKQRLLLLPGLLCDAALWQFQSEALADVAEVTVADLTRSDSIAAMARDALAAAPDRFALAGLSMGGYVALEIMRQAPERVTHLALLDTSARPDAPELTERRKALIDLASRGKFKGVTPRLLPLLLHKDHQFPPLSTIVIDMAARIGQPAFVRQETAIMGRADSRPFLKDIKVPTLVLVGEDDALTPVHLHEELADGIAGSEFQIIARSGHLTTLEKPDMVNRAMFDWLTS